MTQVQVQMKVKDSLKSELQILIRLTEIKEFYIYGKRHFKNVKQLQFLSKLQFSTINI